MLTISRPVRLLLAATLGLGIPVVQAGHSYGDRVQLEQLSGVYQSTGPEAWFGAFGTRKFTFKSGTFELVFVHAMDSAMKERTFQYRTGGQYLVRAASTRVPGAFEAVFFEDAKYVTLLTADEKLIHAFGFAGCGLKLNVEVDISKSGCAKWKPVDQCWEDHDLLAIEAEGLYFGVRPRDNDMCSPAKRATALLQPVVKQ